MKMRLLFRLVSTVLGVVAVVGVSWYLVDALLGSGSGKADLSGYQSVSDYPVRGIQVDRIFVPTVEDLTNSSELVVIGTPQIEGEVTRTEAGELTGLSRNYDVAVERYLKGLGGPTLTIRVGIGSEDRVKGSFLVPDDGGILPTLGARYVMFLRESEEARSWTGTGFPWLFLIDGSSVSPVGAEVKPVLAAGQSYPTTLDAFVASVSLPGDGWIQQNMQPTGFPSTLGPGDTLNPVEAIGLAGNIQRIILLRPSPSVPIYVDDPALVQGVIDALDQTFVLEPYVETDLMRESPVAVMLEFKYPVAGLTSMSLRFNTVTGAIGGPRLQIILPSTLATQLNALLVG